MKKLLALLALATIVGCALQPLSSSDRRPLPIPLASDDTNAPAAVAALNAVARLNDSYNATTTREPLSILIGTAITAASAAAGWIARHKTQRRDPPPS